MSTMPATVTREELEAYLEKHDIRAKLKDCLNALLQELPDEPLPFIRTFFGGGEVNPARAAATPSAEAAIASDSELLRAAVGSDANLGLGNVGLEVDQSSSEEESESESEEDELGELPAMDIDFEEEERKKRERIGNRRRNSVSSETVRHAEIQKEFPVHPKTPAQEMNIFNILSNSILLKHLEAGPSQIITKAMFKRDLKAGEVVMRQNEEGDNFYIIDEGICDIYVAGLDPLTDEGEEGPATSEHGGRVQITRAGDSFGELALMYNAPRAATVVARTDVGLWAVDRTTFRTLVMGSAIAKRSKHSSYLEGVELLSTLTQAERETVIDNMQEEEYADGDIVIAQGEMGSKFFIVTGGALVVTQKPDGSDESREVGRLKEGSYFGEIALLTNQQRLATVKAVSQVRCVTIERKVFSRVMGPLRDLLQRNMSLYNSYISLNL